MLFDLQGSLSRRTLSSKKGLHPVFEAITNSIHAIQDVGAKKGKIDVIIHRDKSQGEIFDSSNKAQKKIIGFTIRDNGIGFTDENLKSFNTIYSMRKKQIGGKGVGRLLYLQVFDEVEIESVYKHKGEKLKRVINFHPMYDPETDIQEISADKNDVLGTNLKLKGFKEEFEKNSKKTCEKITDFIVEQCLPFFALDQMPSLTIIDDDETGEHYSAKTVYEEFVYDTDDDSFEVLEEKFDLKHVLFRDTKDFKHGMHLCGNNRVVNSQSINSKNIAGLEERLTSGSQDSESSGFVYASYVSGHYLDKNVNDDRSEFRIQKEADEDSFISLKEIQSQAINRSKEFLSKYTEKTIVTNRQRIETFITTKKPKYRHLMKYHSAEFGRIPSTTPESELDKELYKIQIEVDYKLQEKIQKLLSSNDDFFTDEKHLKIIEELEESSKAKLAEHVVLRHYVIETLEKAIRLNPSGEYSSEDVIHKIIYPMSVESGDLVDIDDHNLWVLDERLAFHHYLSSDKKLHTNPFVETDSQKRLDLLIFNKAFVMGDKNNVSRNNVAIIEFKKPMRDDYKEGTPENYKSDPDSQIIAYIKSIRAGKEVKEDGTAFVINDSTMFECYLVASLTPKLRELLDDDDYRLMPDLQEYYRYHSNLKAHIHVISYEKLIDDAKKRNHVLFEKLRIPAVSL